MKSQDTLAAGTIVTIIREDGSFYDAGTKAKLTHQDGYGNFWAQFRGLGNAPGSFDDSCGGEWCIGRNAVHFQVAEQAEEDKESEAKELAYLRWFFQNAEFGPADDYVRHILEREYMKKTGEQLPEGYRREQ